MPQRILGFPAQGHLTCALSASSKANMHCIGMASLHCSLYQPHAAILEWDRSQGMCHITAPPGAGTSPTIMALHAPWCGASHTLPRCGPAAHTPMHAGACARA